MIRMKALDLPNSPETIILPCPQLEQKLSTSRMSIPQLGQNISFNTVPIQTWLFFPYTFEFHASDSLSVKCKIHKVHTKFHIADRMLGPSLS